MTKYKYPRTPHLPWSPGFSSDDVNFTQRRRYKKHMGHPNFPKHMTVKIERTKDKERLSQPAKEFTPPKEDFLYNVPVEIQTEALLAEEDI